MAVKCPYCGTLIIVETRHSEHEYMQVVQCTARTRWDDRKHCGKSFVVAVKCEIKVKSFTIEEVK